MNKSAVPSSKPHKEVEPQKQTKLQQQQMLPFSTTSSSSSSVLPIAPRRVVGNMAPPSMPQAVSGSHGMPRTASVPWTRQELDEIGQALDTPLTNDEIARRVGKGGQKFSYIEGWFVLDQCNRIFGATGWSCEIKDIQVRVRPDKNKGWYAKARVISRVTLKDGTFHEDISVAGKYNKNEHEAEMMACKTAVTDARKRVLRCFGRALGNSVYDKTTLQKCRKRSAPVPQAPPAYNRICDSRQQTSAQQKQQIGRQQQQQQQQNQARAQKEQPIKHQAHANPKSSGPPVDRTNIALPPSAASAAPPSACASFKYSVVDTPVESSDPNDAFFGDEEEDKLFANVDMDQIYEQAAKRQRTN